MQEVISMLGARILLIEDDEALADLISRNLQARAHDVAIARDARSSLELLRSQAFDLILLDINLPDQTGWEILRTAQREGLLQEREINGNGPKLPVVVLSAVRVSPRRLEEFHPLAYLPKTFPLEALLRLAAEATEERGANVKDQHGGGTAV